MGAAAVIGNTSRLPELVGVWRLDVRLVKTFDECWRRLKIDHLEGFVPIEF